jgi:hypothetical protein
MTGRGAGFCAGYSVPGYMNPVGGRGFGGYGGWGRGRGGGGWGRRNQFYATGLPGWQRAGMGYPAYGSVAPDATPYDMPFAPAMTKEQELESLKGQAEYFEDALEGIKKRVEELQTKAK